MTGDWYCPVAVDPLNAGDAVFSHLIEKALYDCGLGIVRINKNRKFCLADFRSLSRKWQ